MQSLQKLKILTKYRNNFLTRIRMNFSSDEDLREKEEFKKFVDFLLERSSYNWEDHQLQAINSLKDLRKLKNYARGEDEKAKEILKNDKINMFTSALLEDEKDSEQFPKVKLQEIRDVTGLSESDTKTIISHFKYYKGLQGYLYKKKIKNEYIPEDNIQLKQFLMIERPEFIVELNKEKYQDKKEERKKKMTKKERNKLSLKEQNEFLRRIKTWQI